jgi:xanthine dehydrogenase accessory factor
MRDLLQPITDWFENGERVALATVVSTWGSSPRPAGSIMAVSSSGKIAGSVSGGCVESAVVERALAVLGGGSPELMHFGVSDETAWEVGLACGGTIEVFISPLGSTDFEHMKSIINRRQPLLYAIILSGSPDILGKTVIFDGAEVTPDEWGLLAGADRLPDRIRSALTQHMPQRITIEGEPDLELFINTVLPPERLLIVGGVHIAIALASLAQRLDYETVVVDPRRLFASPDRFPGVDQLIQAWPQEALSQLEITSSTAVAVLTHDPKIDDPAVIAALNSPAFYVGVLGSRKTHAARLERLRKAGVEEEALARIHAPIGLDLGAKSPEEMALSILAEIVASRRKR